MPEDRERYAEDDPRHHTIKIGGMLGDLRDHLREDVPHSPTRRAWVAPGCSAVFECVELALLRDCCRGTY